MDGGGGCVAWMGGGGLEVSIGHRHHIGRLLCVWVVLVGEFA